MAEKAFRAKTDTKEYKKAMKKIAKVSMPRAVAEVLNIVAQAVTKNQRKIVKKKLIVRQASTLSTMESRAGGKWKILNAARGKDINRMFSRAGSRSPYLWRQEEKGETQGVSGRPVPVPTLRARTGKSADKRIKKVENLSRTSRGRLVPSKYNDPKGRRFVGRPHPGWGKGLWLRNANNTKIKMIYSTQKRSIPIKGIQFHRKSVARYGTPQFRRAQYIKVAATKLKEFM